MSGEIKVINEKKIKVLVAHGEPPLEIRRGLMEEYTNEAGVKMLKYRYWRVTTKHDVFCITEPEEHQRILKAMNNPEVRFVKIDSIYVNISYIAQIEEKVGYKKVEE